MADLCVFDASRQGVTRVAASSLSLIIPSLRAVQTKDVSVLYYSMHRRFRLAATRAVITLPYWLTIDEKKYLIKSFTRAERQ